MTRKRFVKLLMAKGYSRNSANAAAICAQNKGYSYETAYRLATAIPNLVDRLAPAIKNIADTAWKMSKALAAGFAAFGEAYRAALNGAQDSTQPAEAEE